ncbi:MAG: anthranilate phosphoribosyltransferase [Verrucomicrobia bacterium]|nr:anthranilate phosphoribosyltransferase [Verrucomicrobiota bacterium]
MIRETIAALSEGTELTFEEALESMRQIMRGDATPAQIAGYLMGLRIRGESPMVIAASAQAMRENFTAVPPPEGIVVDTCGTGGDGTHTFNISTASAFVVAGAGVTVAKHGNRSVSSKSGSADVLEALGVNISVPPETMATCLREVGIAFLFAPSLHPAMKHAIGPRKELGIRTLFNILGPLSNPAGAKHGVIGVYADALVETVAEASAKLGAEHLFVVHGKDGLDELTTTAETRVAEVKNGKVTVTTLSPEDVGLHRAAPGQLKGGDASVNADIIRALLNGQPGPARDIVALNAAAAIVAGQKTATLREGLDLAFQSIDSGAAREKLASLIARTQS